MNSVIDYDRSSMNRAPYILFWIISSLLFFWALGSRGLSGSEGRWAEIIREMFLTGDFFHHAEQRVDNRQPGPVMVVGEILIVRRDA